MRWIHVVTIGAMLSVPSSFAATTYQKVAAVGNGVFVVGGLGVFAAAVINSVIVSSNSTALQPVYNHVAGSSLTLFVVGSALSIVASELNHPELLERIDEFTSGMTGLAFGLVAVAIWTSNFDLGKTGVLLLYPFFIAKACHLPLLIKKNAAILRPSDKVLLVLLTVIGNGGGALLAASVFTTASYASALHQAGLYALGIVIPITLTGITINLLRGIPQS
jgi:hypothetical protein